MSNILHQLDFIILIRLIASHLLVDFLLQPDKWVKEKAKKRFRSVFLYVHGLLAGILAYLFVGSWDQIFVPVIITATHILIDGWKSYKPATARYFIADQLLHLFVIFIVWSVFFNSIGYLSDTLKALYNSANLWIVLSGYITAIWPMAFLISLATKKWRKQIQNKDKITSLGDAGKWIGRIERFLIVTFVLFGRFDAIGFLIAAKSVFRFGDVKDNNDRREAEYILIGTLLSFAMAIFLGIIMRLLMGI